MESTVPQADVHAAAMEVAERFRADWMSVQEAAKMIGCSRQALYDRVSAGKLHSSKIGAVRYLRRAEVEAEILRVEELAAHPERYTGRGRGGMYKAAVIRYRERIGDPVRPDERLYRKYKTSKAKRKAERERYRRRQAIIKGTP